MRRSRTEAGAVLALCLAIAAAGPASGHDGTGHGAGEPAAAENDASATIALHDLELVDETGKPLRFVSDALAGRIVAIDFVYTTCTTVCPIVSSVFSLVQDGLGERAGTEVWLVSVSIDPVRDTPRRLADYAAKFDAGRGWIWLTGEKARVDRVLAGLGAYTPEIVDHPPMVVIGDAERGVWRRLFGFPAPEDILKELDALAAAREAAKTTMNLGE